MMMVLQKTPQCKYFLFIRRYFGTGKSEQQALNPLEYCMKLVRERDYEGYMCCTTMPIGGPREAAIAIRAFNVEIAQTRGQITRNYSDLAGKFRLQFWKDTVRTIYGDKDAPATVPRQPVAAMLQRFVGPPHGKVSQEYLQYLVEARQKTLEDRQFKSIRDLDTFSLHTHGGILFACLQAMDIAPKEVTEAVGHLSKALGVMTQLRAVVPLAHHGIVILPEDFLAKHSVKPSDILRASKEDKMKAMALAFADYAEEHLRKSRQSQLPKDAWMALQPAIVADYLLKALRKSQGDLFSGRLQQPNASIAFQILRNRITKTF